MKQYLDFLKHIIDNGSYKSDIVTMINNLASDLEDKGFLTEYNWRCEFDGWVWFPFS